MKLEIQGLTKRFGEQTVLNRIDLHLQGKSSLVLIGPSGGGKTTLLRILAGLEQPDEGAIRFEDRDLPRDEKLLREYRMHLGVVFQSYNLFTHLTALKNITLPLEIVHGMNPDEAVEKAQALLSRFQLGDHAAKMPVQLSGGQRQRVAIVRALSAQPSAILLDEPTSALDPEMTAEVLDLIQELKSEGRPLILVTHQMGFARRMADHVIFLADGSILEQGNASELFQNPRTEGCRRFLDKVLKY